MDPLLATGALSLAGQVVRNLTTPKAPKPAQVSPGDQPRFAELLARASSSPQVQMAGFLEERGVRTVGEAERRIEQLSTQLLQTPEVQSFVAGSGNALSLQVSQDGGVSIRTSDGRERTFQLLADERKIASEMHTIGAALRNNGGIRADSLTAPTVFHVIPGAGVSLDGNQSR